MQNTQDNDMAKIDERLTSPKALKLSNTITHHPRSTMVLRKTIPDPYAAFTFSFSYAVRIRRLVTFGDTSIKEENEIKTVGTYLYIKVRMETTTRPKTGRQLAKAIIGL